MTQAFDASAQQALLEARAAAALEQAREAGADACEVGASVDQGINVSVRMGEVETVELTRDQGIAVTVYVGQRKGSASSSDASEASIRALVDRALTIARQTGEDTASGLADKALMATELPDLKVHHPWQLSTDQAIEMALACEQAGRGAVWIGKERGTAGSGRLSTIGLRHRTSAAGVPRLEIPEGVGVVDQGFGEDLGEGLAGQVVERRPEPPRHDHQVRRGRGVTDRGRDP